MFSLYMFSFNVGYFI